MKNYLILLFLLITTSGYGQQCSATTKAGNQCKNKIQLNDTKCKIHSDNTTRCGQLTKTGGKCKMIVKQPGDRCRFHKI